MFKKNKNNKEINNNQAKNKINSSNSYRFKEILKYKKNENHEHHSDVELTIKYDIVKPEVQYKNFYENWIEKNIGSDENTKNINTNLKTKKINHK